MKSKLAVVFALGVCLAMVAPANAEVIGGASFDFVDITATQAAADFRIGLYEVTVAQYNAVMGTSGGTGNLPKQNVGFMDAIDFANNLNVLAGTPLAYNVVGGVLMQWGATGAYRNPATKFFVVNELEFEDAGYQNGATLQLYTTPGDTANTTAEACYNAASPWAVGSGAMEVNGTFDMAGNVNEWMENDKDLLYPETAGANHRLLGGYFSATSSFYLQRTFKYIIFPANDPNPQDIFGFRIGSTPGEVPEPATMSLLALGGLAVLRRRKK